MSGRSAARLGNLTTCPLPGHSSSPIVGDSPGVLFSHRSAVHQGDVTTCGATLSAGVIVNALIDGKSVAVVGSVGTHGNLAVGDVGTVLTDDSDDSVPALAPAPPKLCL